MNELTTNRINEINNLHNEIGGALKMTLEKAIRMGELLTEQKTEFKHGGWTVFVNENLSFNIRQAQKYMMIFKNKGMIKTTSDSFLCIDSSIDKIKQKRTEEKRAIARQERFDALSIKGCVYNEKLEEREKLYEENKIKIDEAWKCEIKKYFETDFYKKTINKIVTLEIRYEEMKETRANAISEIQDKINKLEEEKEKLYLSYSHKISFFVRRAGVLRNLDRKKTEEIRARIFGNICPRLIELYGLVNLRMPIIQQNKT